MLVVVFLPLLFLVSSDPVQCEILNALLTQNAVGLAVECGILETYVGHNQLELFLDKLSPHNH